MFDGGKMGNVEETFAFEGNNAKYFRFVDDSALELELKTTDLNHFLIWIRKNGTIDYEHEKGKYGYNYIEYKTLKKIENKENPFTYKYTYEGIKSTLESEDTSDLKKLEFILSVIGKFYNEFEGGDFKLIKVKPPRW